MTIQQKRSDFIVPRERSPGSEGLNERQKQEIEGTSRACSEGPLFRRLPQLLLRGEGIHLAGSVLQVVVEGTSRGHLVSRSSLDWPAPTLWLPSAPPACSTTVMWPTSSTKQPKGNPAMLLLGALFLFVAGAPGLPIIFTHPLHLHLCPLCRTPNPVTLHHRPAIFCSKTCRMLWIALLRPYRVDNPTSS